MRRKVHETELLVPSVSSAQINTKQKKKKHLERDQLFWYDDDQIMVGNGFLLQDLKSEATIVLKHHVLSVSDGRFKKPK